MDAGREINKNYQGPQAALTPASAKQPFNQFGRVNDRIMTTLLIELKIPTHLDDLNDDCLLEIFSQNSLTLMDLCALAETCTLFKGIAQRVFPKSLYIETCFYRYGTRIEEFVGIRERIKNVERIFERFGRCLVTVTVRDASDAMSFVAKHCAAGTLKELDVCYIKINKAMAVKLKPILQQLRNFSIRDGTFKCGANEILKNNFSELERFTFQESWRDSSSEMLNFLERHRSVKFVGFFTHFNAMDDFVRKLCSSHNELEELEIGSFARCPESPTTPTLDFSDLLTLKRLRLWCPFTNGERRWIVQLQNSKSLEVLDIDGTFVTKEFKESLPLLTNLLEMKIYIFTEQELIPSTSFPKQLTKLSFSASSYVAVEYVVDLVRQLSNLEKLEIFSALSEKPFYEIVKLVEGRRNVLALKCGLTSSWSSETIKKICHENLKVKLVNF